MPDPKSSASPSSHPRSLDLVAAKKRLNAFVAIVKNAVSVARQHAGPVGNNSVVVDRTGERYPTINAALDSITDASQQKQYALLIGAGTYTSILTCKSWVFLSGAGREQTLITALTEPNAAVPATITAASHSAVQDCTVRATTQGPGPSVTAVLCKGPSTSISRTVSCSQSRRTSRTSRGSRSTPGRTRAACT
jgi:pectin methylesterase-like acyl-CoA thioesterase